MHKGCRHTKRSLKVPLLFAGHKEACSRFTCCEFHDLFLTQYIQNST